MKLMSYTLPEYLKNIRAELESAYKRRPSLYEGKITSAALKDKVFADAEEALSKNTPVILIRANALSYLLHNAEVTIDPVQYFADGINCEDILSSLRWTMNNRIHEPVLDEVAAERSLSGKCEYFHCGPDYGHLCPDWNALFRLGFRGILDRIEGKTGVFYDACRICYEALIDVALRLADKAKSVGKDETAENLTAIACHAPETFAQALQLMYLCFRVFEYIDGQRTRSLGGFDAELFPFYKKDLPRIGEDKINDLLAYFFLQCWSMHVPFDLPMYIGGGNALEAEDFACRIVSVYTALDIYSPKIHVRLSKSMSDRLPAAVCDSIRRGNSSFVFISDETAEKALMTVGISAEDAKNYVPIGCYEPTVLAKEIGCTGCGSINFPKSILLTLFGGNDIYMGQKIGITDAEIYPDYNSFYTAVLAEFAHAVEICEKTVSAYERHYGEIYPIPLLSATFESCIASGRDALEGGAVYNNSSLTVMGIGTAVDSLYIIRQLYENPPEIGGRVFDIPRLKEALKANWDGFAAERQWVLTRPKYGNNQPAPDAIASKLAAEIADIVRKPNARGGFFKPGLFSIDHCITYGAKTSASPDGRFSGDPLSKNDCPSSGRDKAGVTAEITSAAKLHPELFPNGSVLDIMLHPSAVGGDEGLNVMISLIRTFFAMGGFAIHGNVVSAETLTAAQQNPEKYANLQVRLCGWNVFFVNLSKIEQDELIRAAS